MAIYFRARDRREVSASEALDARGLLRSGYGQRVSYAMRDGVSRLTDARSFWDQHRAELLVTDARGIGGVEGCRPGYRVFDADVGRAERDAAYREFEAYLNDSWRNPPPRDAGFGALDKKIKKYNARGQEEGYLEETEEGDAALGDARKKEDPPVTGRSKCPACDGSGVVHGKYCQACGGDGWVDDGENNEDDNGEAATADRRMRDAQAVSAAHQQNMARIYQQIADDVSQQWRER